MRTPFSVIAVVALLVAPVDADPNQASTGRSAGVPAPSASTRFALTVDSIMRGPALVGYPPTGLRWSGDSRTLYFEWRQPGDEEAATWAHDAGEAAPRRLTDDERRLAPPVGGTWDRPGRRVVAVQDGDIVLIDTVARTRRMITRTSGAEANARWARSETHVTFTRDNGLFIVPVATDGDLVEQLLDAGPKRPDPRTTESQTFLRQEERALIDHVREQAARREAREAREKARAVPSFELAERQRIADAMLSPAGTHVFLLVAERPSAARVADVPDYVTESSYVEDIVTRSRVGDAQEARRLAILDLRTGTSVWADLGDLAGGAAAPTAPRGGDGRRGERTREVRWSMPVVSADGAHVVVSVRAADNKDRWLVRLEPGTGETRLVDHLHDDAWIREIGGFGGAAGLGWLPDERTLWFLSERDGWMHLYVVDAASPGSPPRQLTAGPWEITSIQLSPDRRSFIIASTEVHPGERQVSSLPIEGGSPTRLTMATGAHAVVLSPDGQLMANIHSTGNRPPEVFVGPARAGAEATRLTTSPSAEWLSHPWLDPQLVSFRARDGVEVPARLYTPEMVGARRDGRAPAVVFVHGAGYLQNAHRYWSTYYREYMFHHLLASRGYVVLDVDYRASAGYGRDWRTAIYRHMGGKDLDDIIDGAKYLVERHRVHPERIGVYGGSYGGFITLMAMFTSPGTFAAGAALRPVTDWAHYSHGYTSNILNPPHLDAEAYRRSSPIYFADGLRGALLICHGMVDTNVHFQDSVRLAQRLIELRKPDWELAAYPVENHGFENETSWADQYRRILALFERHLRGPRAR